MLFGGSAPSATMRRICDEPRRPEPAALLRRCPERHPVATQFKISGTYPLPWGIQVSARSRACQADRSAGSRRTTGNKISGPGYGDDRQPDRHELADHADHALPGELPGAVPGGSRWSIPGMTVGVAQRAAGRAGDRIPGAHQPARSQHLEDRSSYGRASFQPKIDFFNLLNVSPVIDVRNSATGMLFGTASYMQPSSVLEAACSSSAQ